ncbi:hypothetical protein F8O05_10900 [Gulosibacter chungangensis]|uniref:Uncharacterized protein n=1 Tax=Gulosibacter chungangensis TaxID=979746 RepID=A0A7J5B9W0_9MICO|nr:hypothetical protein F8O05_10900 [Gulosibacter chungangensis]
MAKVARFLLSKDAFWVMGMSVSVDDGRHLRRGADRTRFVGIRSTERAE